LKLPVFLWKRWVLSLGFSQPWTQPLETWKTFQRIFERIVPDLTSHGWT
jgi:hypothetical protein